MVAVGRKKLPHAELIELSTVLFVLNWNNKSRTPNDPKFEFIFIRLVNLSLRTEELWRTVPVTLPAPISEAEFPHVVVPVATEELKLQPSKMTESNDIVIESDGVHWSIIYSVIVNAIMVWDGKPV